MYVVSTLGIIINQIIIHSRNFKFTWEILEIQHNIQVNSTNNFEDDCLYCKKIASTDIMCNFL